MDHLYATALWKQDFAGDEISIGDAGCLLGVLVAISLGFLVARAAHASSIEAASAGDFSLFAQLRRHRLSEDACCPPERTRIQVISQPTRQGDIQHRRWKSVSGQKSASTKAVA